MMNINTHNYEAFLLDFSEGQLSDQEVLLLRNFIAAHPELGSWEELTEELPSLEADMMYYENKDALKQNPDFLFSGKAGIQNFDLTAINYLENELSNAEKQTFEKVLKNDTQLKHEFALLKLTYLKESSTKAYPDFSYLKKSAVPVVLLKTNFWVGVAASFLLLFSAAWWFLKEPAVRQTHSAQIFEMQAMLSNKNLISTQYTEKPLLAHRPFANPDQELPLFNDEIVAAITPELTPLKSEEVNWTAIGHILYNDDWQTMQYYFNGEAFLARISDQREKEKSLAGLILANASRRVVGLFSSKKQQAEDIADQANDVFYTQNQSLAKYPAMRLIEMSVKTYNFLTDNELELKKYENEQGQIKAIEFDSNTVSFKRNLKTEAKKN